VLRKKNTKADRLKKPYNRQELIVIHVNAKSAHYCFLKRWFDHSDVFYPENLRDSSMAVFSACLPPFSIMINLYNNVICFTPVATLLIAFILVAFFDNGRFRDSM